MQHADPEASKRGLITCSGSQTVHRGQMVRCEMLSGAHRKKEIIF